MESSKIRNVAIIAHVDHGKTTLVDGLLKQSGAFRENQVVSERVMDSNDQERERGITIFSKNASAVYKDHLINIVDTPGHADFGGQVERVLGTVDGALLIVDAFEGPMAQTRFVTKKALELGLTVAVVINKIDRPGCEPMKALDKVFDLFVDLGASDEQLDFKYVFAAGRNGTSRRKLEDEDSNFVHIFNLIVDTIPAPKVGAVDAPALLQITSLDFQDFLGRMAVGRLRQGSLKMNQTVTHINAQGVAKKVRVTKILFPEGVKLKEIPEAIAGQIVCLCGIPDFTLGDTITADENPVALPRIAVDPPTIAMRFWVNDSPFCGLDGGKFLTANHMAERLEREAISDVALHVKKLEDGGYSVAGRGVMHISVIIEKMRREGYEFTVGRPRVLTQEIDGVEQEPIETITVHAPQDYAGMVIDEINKRRGEMLDMTLEGAMTRVVFDIPARGVIGLRTRLLSLSKGYAVFQQLFKGYEPLKGHIEQRPTGALISKERGTSAAYALWKLEERGVMFIGAGTEVYTGMIVGENNRADDLVINVIKGKQLTNMRTTSADEATTLTPHRQMSLEECLEFINDDECVECTPKSMRLRKILLDENARKRAG